MNKVYVLAPNENWIVDRFVKEWSEHNDDITTKYPKEADVIWLLADWSWKNLSYANPGLLAKKKVITSVHHIVPEKFNYSRELNDDFKMRDSITDIYHVYNQSAYNFVSNLTTKPIKLIKYWANQYIWNSAITQQISKSDIRDRLNVPQNSYVVGSFQRDTEGHDLITPKLEKGPDLLADALEKLKNKEPNLHVLLGGWRRQYIIKRLEKANIPYTYIERPAQEIVNDMYSACDLYMVTARYEGGPQALIECGLTNTPCVSTNVGIASQVLPSESINEDVTLAIPNVPNVKEWELPQGYQEYRNLIQSL